MRAEDRQKLLAPDHEPTSVGTTLSSLSQRVLVGLVIGLLGLAMVLKSWVVGVLSLPLWYALVSGASGGADDLGADFVSWADQRMKFGLVVISNSPKWSSHIEQTWIPKFGDYVTVLNLSHKGEWPESLERRVFERFGSDRDYCPTVYVPRSGSGPAIYRFNRAFEACKHGNSEPLTVMEGRLFLEFDAWVANKERTGWGVGTA